MKKDRLRLGRAFTEAPSELHDSIEEAFERGAKEMKRRHKWMTALSVAAACAAIFAGLALAAGQLTRPRPDMVMTERGRATAEPTEEELTDLMTEITPEPTPMPEFTAKPTPETRPETTPMPTPVPEVKLVYTQPQSNYYHSVPDCSGMVGAIEWTEASAISVGKQPCPVCITGKVEIKVPNTPMPESEAPFEAPVYYTAGGVYYHGDEQCSGMLNAEKHTLDEAEADGKLRCPVCQPGEPDHYDLFKKAFGQGLEALVPGWGYSYCGDDTDFFGENCWFVTDGEATIRVCHVGSYLKADGGRDSIYSYVGTHLEDVFCVNIYTDELDKLCTLWPFLSETEAGALALSEKDEAVEHMIEKLGYDGPLNLEEGNVWVAIGSNGVIRELEVYYVDDDSDITVTLAWTLIDGEYVFTGTVE